MPNPEPSAFLMMLSRFRVGGFNDESGDYTEPVQVTCTQCSRPSPPFTFRDDGGADYTADLRELADWAQAHQCRRNVGGRP